MKLKWKWVENAENVENVKNVRKKTSDEEGKKASDDSKQSMFVIYEKIIWKCFSSSQNL